MFPWRRLQSTRERRRSLRTARRAGTANAARPISTESSRSAGSSARTRTAPDRWPTAAPATAFSTTASSTTASSATTRPTTTRPATAEPIATTAAAPRSGAARPTAATPTRISARSASTGSGPASVRPRAPAPSGTSARASGTTPSPPTGSAAGGHRVHSPRRQAHCRSGALGRRAAGVVAGSRTRIGEVGHTFAIRIDASVLAFPGSSTGPHRVRPASATGAVHRGAQETGSTGAAGSASTRTRSAAT